MKTRRMAVGFAAFTALAMIILSCASDIELSEELSLKGVYKGRYIVTELGEQEVQYVQVIDWKFTDQDYNMSPDIENPHYNENYCVCPVYGKYELKDKVYLTQVGEGLPQGGCSTCRQTHDPMGAFGIESHGDTLTLSRTDRDIDPPLLKELILIPISKL